MRIQKRDLLAGTVLIALLVGFPCVAVSAPISDDLVTRYIRCCDSIFKAGASFAEKSLTGEISDPSDQGFSRLVQILKECGFQSYDSFQEADQMITRAYFQVFPSNSSDARDESNVSIEGEFGGEEPQGDSETLADIDDGGAYASSGGFEEDQAANVPATVDLDPASKDAIRRFQARLQPAMTIKVRGNGV